jgi:hypothetical protein
MLQTNKNSMYEHVARYINFDNLGYFLGAFGMWPRFAYRHIVHRNPLEITPCTSHTVEFYWHRAHTFPATSFLYGKRSWEAAPCL